MSAPKRKRKQSAPKGRFRDAISAMDRWTLPRLPVDPPWKRYGILLGSSVIGGLIVFGGLSALISPAGKTNTADHAATPIKSGTENKHAKATSASHQPKSAAKEAESHKSISLNGTAFISGSNAAIRERPAINGKIIERAVFGSNVELITQEGKWVQVRSPGQNISGWIEKAYLSF